MYFSLVRSILEYSATVWHPRQKYDSDKLEMVQSRAARFVKGRYGMFESVTQMLEQLLILIVNWQDSRLSIKPMFHSDEGDLNVCSFSFNMKPSTLSTFSMPNGRLFQLEIVAGKKEYLYESQFAWRCLNLKL